MNTNIDSHRLIAAVSKRPPLYNKTHKLYYSHNVKQRLWKETCAEIYPNWEMLHSHKKIEYCCREVQKRWKNLRTCFVREVALQQKEDQDRKEGREVKPRKIYEYYKIMRFMLSDDLKAKLDAIQNNAQTENDNVDGGDDPLENMKPEHEPQITYYTDDTYDNDDENIMVLEPEERYASEHNAVNEIAKDDDDDKHFLMSLLRTFRQLDDKQKFEAKIEILKTLRTIQFPDD